MLLFLHCQGVQSLINSLHLNPMSECEMGHALLALLALVHEVINKECLIETHHMCIIQLINASFCEKLKTWVDITNQPSFIFIN